MLTKIGNLDSSSARDEAVSGCQVAMDASLEMEIVHASTGLNNQWITVDQMGGATVYLIEVDKLLSIVRVLAVLEQMGEEVATGAKLHDDQNRLMVARNSTELHNRKDDSDTVLRGYCIYLDHILMSVEAHDLCLVHH